MIQRSERESRWLLFVLGLAGWLVLWTAYYAAWHSVDPVPNLAAAIFRVLAAIVINLIVIVLLLLTRYRWVVLGYMAAILLNGVGLLLVNGWNILYFVSTFPFFLPTSLRP